MAADVAALETPIAEEAAAVFAHPSPLMSFWAAFRENRGAVFGLAVFGLVVLLATPGVLLSAAVTFAGMHFLAGWPSFAALKR